jgi:hypothetical protein
MTFANGLSTECGLWMIRRLKVLGANNNDQIDVDNWFMPKTSQLDNVQTGS